MKNLSLPITLLALPWVCSVFGCSLTRATAQSATAQSATAHWSRHTQPDGLMLECPQGWSVEKNGDTLLVSSQDRSSFSLIVAFSLSSPGATAEACVCTVVPALGRYLPDAHITAVKPLGHEGGPVQASLTYQSHGQAADARLICSLTGEHGILYAIAAPHTQFTARRQTLMHILQSLQYPAPQREGSKATADGTAAPQLSFVSWTDPNEGAFHVDIPEGWKTQGGMIRRHALDTRVSFDVLSPDGETLVRYGDASLPGYMPPNRMLNSCGFGEGSTYTPGGLQYVIARFMPGSVYGHSYLQQRISGPFSDLHIVSEKERPDIAQSVQAAYERNGRGLVHYSVSMGEIAFTCTRDGKPLRGLCEMLTVCTQSGQFVVWSAFPMGYVAPRSQIGVAEAALHRMIASFHVDPNWSMRQSNTAARCGAIQADANKQVEKIMMDTYWHQQAVQTDMGRVRSNTTLGLTDAKDPETGESWKVDSGYRYYWHNGNTIVGTNTVDRPGLDFTQLTEW